MTLTSAMTQYNDLDACLSILVHGQFGHGKNKPTIAAFVKACVVG